jgi:hypothetical protein
MNYTHANWLWWANTDLTRFMAATCDRLHLMGCPDPESVVREAMRAKSAPAAKPTHPSIGDNLP